MTIQQANNIPIVEFLSKEGFEPRKTQGHNWWYISPIRLPEKTPSFKVDDKINKWYDHGIGKGGGLVDLALLIYHTDDLHEVLNRLSEGNAGMNKVTHAIAPFPKTDRTSSRPSENRIIIKDVYPLNGNPALTNYIRSRAIPLEIAECYCKAVYYECNKKSYFAIGFENRSGGYELRNQFFKQSSSPKDITLIKNNSAGLTVFEGFMDFLSAVTLGASFLPENSDHLILNSISLLHKNIPLIHNYKQVVAYLDNDAPGQEAFKALMHEGIPLTNASSFYKNHKDVNDFLVNNGRGAPMIKKGQVRTK